MVIRLRNVRFRSQELALVPLLSIKENIFLGNQQAKHGIIDWDLVHRLISGRHTAVGDLADFQGASVAIQRRTLKTRILQAFFKTAVK